MNTDNARSSVHNPKSPAVFIDRDGTLIEEVNFLSRVEDMKLFPYTRAALELLKKRGFLTIIITIQSGIARRVFEESAMHSIHDELRAKLADLIDGFYFCPHLPGEGCRCRKPNLGLIEDAQTDFNIDMANSWFVGDKRIDVETGFNAGIRTAMVLTGYGKEHYKTLDRQPDIVIENLLEAAEEITEKNYLRSTVFKSPLKYS